METGTGETDLDQDSFIQTYRNSLANLFKIGLVMVAILTRTGRAIPGTGVTGL